MDIWRPTIRMDDVFRQYVEDWYRATVPAIDRNRIVRLMLFCAPFSAIFQGTIRDYMLPDVPAPSPRWTRHDSGLWMNQYWQEGRGVFYGDGQARTSIFVPLGKMGSKQA